MKEVDFSRCLCRKCFIRLYKPSRKEIKNIVMSFDKETCEYCGRMDFVVDDIVEDY